VIVVITVASSLPAVRTGESPLLESPQSPQTMEPEITAPPDQIVHQSQIAMPFPERLLVHPDAPHHLRFASRQATLHRPLMMACISSQLSCNNQATAVWIAFSHSSQRFEQCRKATRRFGPRQHDGLDAMVGAFGKRRFGMQNCLILARVQVPPAPALAGGRTVCKPRRIPGRASRSSRGVGGRHGSRSSSIPRIRRYSS